jgi:hypothetical protein
MSELSNGASSSRIRVALVAGWIACLNPLETRGKSAEASVRLEVPAGAWKSVRVEAIPGGTTLSLELRSDGRVEVLLLEAEDYARFPTPRKPVFRGSTEDRISASVRAPSRGDYYVLVDNREGSAARAVEVTIRGDTKDAKAAPSRAAPGGPPEPELKLGDFQAQLGALFEFEAFPIRLETCGRPRAFADASGVVLCQEYVHELRAALGDREKTRDALLFTLFHEIGHVLLKQWRYPTYASEETADEFAAALLVMLGQPQRLEAQAELFDSNASLLEAVARSLADDRHPLSAQRARNLRRWSRDADLARRWQPVFVPKMRTPVLERLLREPTAWTDLALVEAELASRR